MNPQKIAIISELDSPLIASGTAGVGGRQIAIAALAEHVARQGYELDIFTHRTSRQLPQIMPWIEGVRIIHIDCQLPKNPTLDDYANGLPEFSKNVVNFIRDNGHTYESVHAHHWVSGATAMEIKRQLGLPFVVTFHTLGKLRQIFHDPGELFPAQRIAVEEQLVRSADRLIALCPQDQTDLIDLYGADAARITVIPNGIDTETFYPVDRALSRRTLSLNPTEHVILQICRIVPNKDVENIIRALAILARVHQNPARLLIVGGEPISKLDPSKTPETNRLRKLAARLKISSLVTFTGQQSQEMLRYYYSAANIFVTTPWYEPFGITSLESMACGTPVIGSDIGGIKYLVTPDRNGYLVPPQNPTALALCLHQVIGSPALRRRLGAGGLRQVRSLFTWDKVAKQTGELYTEIALRQSPKPSQRPASARVVAFQTSPESSDEVQKNYLLRPRPISSEQEGRFLGE